MAYNKELVEINATVWLKGLHLDHMLLLNSTPPFSSQLQFLL